MGTLLSFIIPVYKVEKDYLCTCIESLTRLPKADVEYILIDDGSPDNAGAICDMYKEQDSRIIVIHTENKGVAEARNIGIDAAKGKYVSFIDADDWIESDKMSQLIEIVKQTDYDLYISGYIVNYVDKEIIYSPFNADHSFENDQEMNELRKMVFVRKYGSLKTDYNSLVMCSSSNKIVRTSLLKDKNIRFDSSMRVFEDAHFFLSVIYNIKRALYTNVCANHYRMRAASVTHLGQSIGYGNDIRIYVEKTLKVLEEKNAPEELYSALYYRCFNLIYEYFGRAYLRLNTYYSIWDKCRDFSNELKKDPFKTAIAVVQVRNLNLKEFIKYFIVRMKLTPLFMIVKNNSEIFKLNDERKYY